MLNIKTKKIIRFTVILTLIFAFMGALNMLSANAQILPDNPNSVYVNIDEPVDGTVNRYLSAWSGQSGLLTFVNSDGSISVLDRENIIIREFSPDMELIKTLSFIRELPEIGAFTKDYAGNYYIFYGKAVEETAQTEKNMVLVKYSPMGQRLNEFWLEARADDSFSGVIAPFRSGTCRIEISGGMIAVYFARTMFRGSDGLNHQASYGFILNINTFERLTGRAAGELRIPYASHSFNQFILPVENGFVFVDHGDAYPRSFAFRKVINDQPNRSINSFRFKGETGQNATFAEMGGLAETPGGYIFAGTYEGDTESGPRNLFILTIDEDMTEISDPVWITNYTAQSDETVVSPKILRIDRTQYLLMWEVYNSTERTARTFKAIANERGQLLESPAELINTQLNGNDILRFNPLTKQVHWAAATSVDSIFKLYSFNPFEEPRNNPESINIWDYSVSSGVLTAYRGQGSDAVIPDIFGVTGIGDRAFRNLTNLTNITIPDSVTSIGNSAFDGCTSLTSITIPDGVTSIGTNIFRGLTGLKSVTIGNGVTEIGNWAFQDLTNLTSVTIGSGVASIGDRAFNGCTSLTNITIPNSVASIGDRAFDGCTNLTDIKIPDGVTSIGIRTFQDCTSLSGIIIPESVTNIHSFAFAGAGSFTIYGKAGSYAETYAGNRIPLKELIPPSAWAAGQIDAAARAQLIPAALQYDYRKNITRAEFAALAVRLYETVTGRTITGRTSFNDTDDINAQKAAAIGIMSPQNRERGLFAPDTVLTRQDSAGTLVRLASLINKPLPEGAANFTDNARIAAWAIEAVGRVQAARIMSAGSGGNFNPTDALTVEECIAAVWRLYNR